MIPVVEGSHQCGYFGGWINVERNKNYDGYSVMWTSNEDTHYLDSANPCISVEFLDDGTIGYICKSAISMWAVKEETDRDKCVEYIENKIKKAFKKKKKRWYEKFFASL